MRFRRSLAAVVLAFLPAAAEAQEAVRLKSAEARWQSGVVHVVVQTDVPDPCIRLGRARPVGVVRNTLSIDVPVLRDTTPACRSRAAGPQSSDYNFPSIARAANTVALRLVRDGAEIARDTVPIRPAALR
ncbi:hypothetical protein E8L99_15280 [Phreatobacter aquaticus]|uniref:Uncharacterized protein n=1 Tax=Phreatobacter aquaticus TaxID=2570229 RepID=A0A4D7QND7_9HYPH|nr:hypothetical protein [Phreatobacter aquaticus]QCK87026.1 hypothetical protein E8L99_15280 [Phreatobacter aquaticus]